MPSSTPLVEVSEGQREARNVMRWNRCHRKGSRGREKCTQVMDPTHLSGYRRELAQVIETSYPRVDQSSGYIQKCMASAGTFFSWFYFTSSSGGSYPVPSPGFQAYGTL